MNQTKHRGIALVVVLSMIVLIALVVAFAISVGGKDTRDGAKQIHNLTVQNVTEGAMQQARVFFSKNQTTWDTYLSIVYPTTTTAASIATFAAANPLMAPAVPAGFACYIYARDDADELPPAPNNPRHDNNHVIYIGAVCSGPGNTTSELTSVLTFDDTRYKYGSAQPASTSL